MDNPAIPVGFGVNPSTRGCPTYTENRHATFLLSGCALREKGQYGNREPGSLISGGASPATPDLKFCGTAARGADLSDMDILPPAFLTQLLEVHSPPQHGPPNHRSGPRLAAATTGHMLADHGLDRDSTRDVANAKAPQAGNLLAERCAGLCPPGSLRISSPIDDRDGHHAHPVPIALFGFKVRLRRHLCSMNHTQSG